METRLVVFPGAYFTLSTWLILFSLYVFPNVKADISCAPCMSPMQVNYAGDEHLRDPPDSGKYPRQDQKKPKLITVLYPNVGVPTGREVNGFPGIAPNAEGINSRAPLGNFTESALDEELFSDEYVKSESELDAALGRVERSVPEFLESADARARSRERAPVCGWTDRVNAPKFAGTGMMSTIPDQTNPNRPAALLLWLETPRTTTQSCTGLEQTAV